MIKPLSFFALSLLLLTGAGCISVEIKPEAAQPEQPVRDVELSEETDEETTEVSSKPIFLPDGLVVKNASNPGVKLDDGNILLLLYENRAEDAGHEKFLARSDASTDWLEFSLEDENADTTAFHALELPDGTYRAFMAGFEHGADTTKGTGPSEVSTGFISMSSEDGETFTEDEGYRYELQPEDEQSIGVWETFIDADGGIVLLYIGDKFGDNTVRRAYSTDNGWTFEFDRFNVLGDQNDGEPGTFVDEKIVSLGDGRWRLITMRQGSVYTFLSEDDGYSFGLEGKVLGPEDFPEYDIATLNDPQLIVLPDGRQRIYVTGMIWTEETKELGLEYPGPQSAAHIFSATTAE